MRLLRQERLIVVVAYSDATVSGAIGDRPHTFAADWHTNATKLLQQERVPLLVLASTSATYGSVISLSKAAGTPLLIAGACPPETLPPPDPLVFCSASFGTTYDAAAGKRYIAAADPGARLALIGVDVPNSRAYTDASEQLAISAGFAF